MADSLLPKIDEIKRKRAGNKFSFLFRHIFEHKNIKKILGTNIALAAILTAGIPATQVSAATMSGTPDSAVIQNLVQFTTQKGIKYPVKTVSITQGFRTFHPGIDLDGITGDPITPIMPGRVEAIQYSRYAYGNAIIINHGNDLTSLYAHLSKILVKAGDEVSPTTVIGLMGATGHATGDHLHLEIRDHGVPINPFTVLPR